MITPMFLFAFQIGDGDIIHVDDGGVDAVLQSDKILGTETHSLCKEDAWKEAISVVRRRHTEEEGASLFMLSTDGFSNSYKNEEEFRKTCTDYYAMIREYGWKAVSENLKGWLTETSEMGCGDDITLLMAYCDSEPEETEEPKEAGKPEETEGSEKTVLSEKIEMSAETADEDGGMINE